LGKAATPPFMEKRDYTRKSPLVTMGCPTFTPKTAFSLFRLLESSLYLRCFLIDYTKAFDTINHPVLFEKLLLLNIRPNVSGRSKAVSSFGQTSGWLPVIQSIHYTRIQYWSSSSHAVCLWFVNSVADSRHGQICRWYNFTYRPTQSSWHLHGIWKHLCLVSQKII